MCTPKVDQVLSYGGMVMLATLLLLQGVMMMTVYLLDKLRSDTHRGVIQSSRNSATDNTPLAERH